MTAVLKSSCLDNKQIARKTSHAIFWNYASFGLGKVLVFVTTAILARLLTPDDFGILAFATLIVSYLSILKDLGLGAALIQNREDIDETANTVFTLNLLLGASLTLISFAVAPVVASYFREPLIIPILRILGFTFVLNALGAIHIVRLQRELKFHRKLVPDLGRSLVKGGVSIGCALAGFGVWSLAIGQIAGAIASTILAWFVFPWRPRLRIDVKRARKLLSYGIPLLGVVGLSVIIDNLDYLFVGRALGNTALGIYTIAYRLPELLVLNTLWVVAAAIFPAYASVQDQDDTLRQGFLTTLRFVEMLVLPISLGLILVADPLVRLAFGHQWLAAIPIVRILGFLALIQSIGFNVGDVYKATGRPDILVKLNLLYLTWLLPALWFGSYYGLLGIAWSRVGAGILHVIVRLLVTTRFMKVTWMDILKQLKPSFLAGIVLICFALPVSYLTAELKPILRLVMIGVTGSTGYLGMLWFLDSQSLLKAGRLIGIPGLKKS